MLGNLLNPKAAVIFVTVIPQFILFNALGWVNTLLPLWVPAWFGGGAFYIFLLRQFFMALPADLDEAALIDGASYAQIYWRILMPLCRPALATVAVSSFSGSWDDCRTPLIYLKSSDVLHSFFLPALRIKQDAVPGLTIPVWFDTDQAGHYELVCAELCGLWHPYMFNNGRVVASAQFQAWAKKQQNIYTSIKPFMDKHASQGGAPYSHTYFPQPDRRAG